MAATTSEQLLAERTQRLRTAVSLGTPDRVPTAFVYDAFAARTTGVKMADYVQSVDIATEAALKTADLLPGLDAVQFPTNSPAVLGLLWLSLVDLPGVELPDDSLWQMHEQALMTVDDYDRIVEMGYGPWFGSFIGQHLSHLLPGVQALGEGTPRAIAGFLSRGIVVFSPAAVTIPYEHFCGGRSMKEFILDLHRVPDKVEAAMQACLPVLKHTVHETATTQHPMAMWVGGWRSASEFLSPKLWDRFVWPYVVEMVQAVAAEGIIPILHFDANWNRDLERFKELPAATCVLALDSMTDIFKAKEILGDHMCLLGDVPPRMLTLGTPEEVRAYSTRLINEVGPPGFILAQGCAIPPDAKLENVRAMIEAAMA
jgi:uroporphyrinogen-III decarboxylase